MQKEKEQPMKYKIRKVVMSDVKTMIPLVEQLGYPISEENLLARIALYHHGLTDRAWIAIQDENIIGCIAIHIYDLFHSTERYGKIVTLIVKDTHRRRGIGRKLIARAERFAIQKNCSALELSSSMKRVKFGSHKFYK